MKTKVFIPLLLAIAAMIGLSSCNSNDDGPQTQIYLDIVTIKSTDATGTVLTLRKLNDSPLVTYTTTQPISGEVVKVGERIIISYTAENGRFENGPIKIYAAAPTIGKGGQIPAKSAADTGQWLTSSLNMNDVFRTGEYLNVVFLSYSAPNPKKCELVADEATLADEYPTVHLLYEPGDGQEMNDYAFYMSYNMNDIVKHDGCKGIKLVYKGSSGVTETKQVEYPYNGFIRPEN
ncbi:MAG: hypothetical protein NC418_01090 [Muribaculaceae bacterium]|nr:hypothetical protein [Muribaculaceae bacterium]